MPHPLLRPTAHRRRCLLQLTCRPHVLYFPFLNKVSTMDDFDNCGCHGGYSYSPSYCAPVADHYAESYNYCTTDPIAIMLRHQREEQERRMFEVEPDQMWTPSAAPLYAPSSGWGSRPATAARSAQSSVDYSDSPALAALAAGHKYYCVPGEPTSWRRPLRCPGGEYDPQWWKMYHHADERSMYLAEQLGYIGARDDDGWIRPTRMELLRMGFWSAQRYVFYYAEFAEQFGRKIPRWVALLQPVRTHAPASEFWD